MGLLDRVTSLDKRLASSFFLALFIAVLFFILGQFWEKHPHLRYQVLSQVPVYDVRGDVTNLDILFDGQSIRQQHQMLTLISIKVENAGNAGITKQSSYDDSFLPGGKIGGGKIIKIDLLAASNGYLTNAVQISKRLDNEFVFSKVILDKGDFFVVKFLVLHPDNAKPQLESFGKIADAPAIDIATIPDATDQRGFFVRAVSGEVGVQATRLAIYMFGGIVFLGISVGSIAALLSKYQTKKRKRHVKHFENSLGAKPTKAQKHILDLYERCGEDEIVRLNQLLCNQKELEYSLRKHEVEKADWNERNLNPHLSPPVRVSSLLESKVITEEGGKISIDACAQETSRSFETFLLGVIPKKMLRCRSQNRVEPFGTESNPMIDPESQKATSSPQKNV